MGQETVDRNIARMNDRPTMNCDDLSSPKDRDNTSFDNTNDGAKENQNFRKTAPFILTNNRLKEVASRENLQTKRESNSGASS